MIRWDVIIVIVGGGVIVTLALAIFSIFVYKFKILALYKEKKHEIVLENFKRYQFFLRGTIGDYAKLIKAFIFIECENFDEATLTLSKIRNYRLLAVKYYWLALIHYKNGNNEEFISCYELFLKSPFKKDQNYDYLTLKNRITALYNVQRNIVDDDTRGWIEEGLYSSTSNFEKQIFLTSTVSIS